MLQVVRPILEPRVSKFGSSYETRSKRLAGAGGASRPQAGQICARSQPQGIFLEPHHRMMRPPQPAKNRHAIGFEKSGEGSSRVEQDLVLTWPLRQLHAAVALLGPTPCFRGHHTTANATTHLRFATLHRDEFQDFPNLLSNIGCSQGASTALGRVPAGPHWN